MLGEKSKSDNRKIQIALAIPGSELLDFKREILEKIDFEDRTFINREANLEKLMENSKTEELAQSIYAAGLINHVYLQKKENDTYRILSGFRRSIAIKKGFDSIENFSIQGQVVIIPTDVSKNDLEKISIHENLHREDLKLSELAFKIYRDSAINKKTFDEIAAEYSVSTGYVKRLKAAVNYDKELIDILNEVGIKRAELLNRIIKLLRSEHTVSEILELYKDYTAKGLEEEIKDLKSKEEKPKYEIKQSKKGATIKLNQALTGEQQQKLEEFLKNL